MFYIELIPFFPSHVGIVKSFPVPVNTRYGSEKNDHAKKL